MKLVNIDDDPFKAAPVEAAREQMTTACSMWASVEPRLVLQIKLTAWPALLAGSVRQLLQGVLTEGTQISAAERAFFTRSSRYESSRLELSYHEGPETMRHRTRKRGVPSILDV